MFRGLRPTFLAAGVALLPALSGNSQADMFTVTSVGGDNTPGSIQPAVDSFRSAVGNPNNGNAPGVSGGRREINWDGAGATTAAVSGPTLDAFTNTRGARFTTPGTSFLQTPLNAPELLNVNPSYGTTFTAFSPQRIFTPLGSNVTDMKFFVPGTNGATPATVSSFGAVFTDVALANDTRMQFFDANGKEILNVAAEPGTVPNGSLSFLGATDTAGAQIAEVRITTGTTALGPNNNPAAGVNVVAMDDFIYSEPVAAVPVAAVPEPATLTLAGFGLIGFAVLSLGRRFLRHRRSN
jgi:hypothetical protein